MKLKHILYALCLVVALIVTNACTEDDPIATKGNIHGKVTEAISNTPISGVRVKLSDDEQSKTTGQDGSYQFTDITAGSYEVSVSKSGYVGDTKSLKVTPEKTTKGDFSIEKNLPTISLTSIQFNNETKSATLTLKNTRSGEMNFAIESSKPWLKVNPLSGKIQAFNEKIITVSVDFEGVDYGNYQEAIVINVGEASQTIPVQVDYEVPSLPELSLSSLQFNNDNTSATLTLKNINNGEMDFAIESSKPWLKVNPLSGKIQASNEKIITVSVDFEGVDYGNYQEAIVINVEGGSKTIPVQVDYAVAPFIEITKPLLNESYKIGEIIPIQWTSNIEGAVKIELLGSGDSTQIIQAFLQQDNGGNYNWTIPTVTVGKYQLKISSLQHSTIKVTSEVFTIEQGPTVPIVLSLDPISTKATSIEIGGVIESLGIEASSLIEYGHVYSQFNPNPSSSGMRTTLGTRSVTGNYTSTIEGLSSDQSYYIAAYATNAIGTAYGEVITVSTAPTSQPIVETTTVTSIEMTSASTGGTVIDDGGSQILESGICWGTTSPVTIDSNTIVNTAASSEDAYLTDIVDLQPGTRYFVRAYAKNESGVGYGAQLEFVTKVGVPVIASTEVTVNSAKKIDCSAILESDGGVTIDSYGFVYAQTADPTLDDASVTLQGEVSNSFSASINDLLPDTNYYIRAYAKNSEGVTYGETQSVKTFRNPVVSTISAVGTGSNPYFSTALVSARIDSPGDLNISSHGFVYSSTVQNPTKEDTSYNTIIDLESSEFEYEIYSSLEANTTYYVRAYVWNKDGYFYGDPLSFTTDEPHSIQVGDDIDGGIVGYVSSTPQDLNRDGFLDYGLVIAAEDQSTGVQWNNGTDIVIGTNRYDSPRFTYGATNTAKIIAAQGEGTYAASVAKAYRGGGYDDWFLPAVDQLKEIMERLRDIGYLWVINRKYWSSSEGTSYGAQYCEEKGVDRFSGIYNNPDNKSELNSVRAVRAFNFTK